LESQIRREGPSGSASALSKENVEEVHKFLARNGHLCREHIPSEALNFCFLIAYGKREQQHEWEEILFKTVKADLNLPFKCLLMAAMNERPVTYVTGLVRAPFHLVKEWFARTLKDEPILQQLFMSVSREELAKVARMKTEDPSLLVQMPSMWEALFLSKLGIAHKKPLVMTPEKWNETVDKILRTNWSVSACTVGEVLEGVRDLIGDRLFQKVMRKYRYSFLNTASQLWLDDVDTAECFVEGVVRVYHSHVFEEKWDEFLHTTKCQQTIPVQLMVVGEKNNWPELVSEVKKQVLHLFKHELSLKELCQMQYNRECDWYQLLLGILPRVLPRDGEQSYLSQIGEYENWESCLLRVCIELFGKEWTREEADKRVFGVEGNLSFWQWAAGNMRNGQLLHIAVEVGSLHGVECTAWPGFIVWRNDHNMTALHLATENCEAVIGSGSPEREVSQFTLILSDIVLYSFIFCTTGGA